MRKQMIRENADTMFCAIASKREKQIEKKKPKYTK
jgi:hypothetical protein